MEYDVEFVKVKDIVPYEKNAKKHPQEQIDYIKNSIKQFGFRQNNRAYVLRQKSVQRI